MRNGSGNVPGSADRYGCSFVALLAIVFTACCGCRARFDEVQMIVDRHAAAVSRLPEEERALLMPYEPPVAGEQVETVLPAGTLDLDEARAIAVRANPDIHAAQARLSGALARIMEARSRYFPSLTFTHTSTRTFHTPASRNRLNTALQPSQPVPTDTSVNEFTVTTLINALRRPLMGDDKPKGDSNAFSEHSTALTASWTLFDGFVRDAKLLASKHMYHAAGASLADIERLIVQAVDAAYYQIQLADERLRIAKADEAFSQDQLIETGKLRDAGRATKADVDNFRVRVLAAQANVTEAEGLWETGRTILAELMALSRRLPDDLTFSPLADETEEEMALPDAEPWIRRALENRPDLVQLEHLLKSTRENLRATQGLYMPTITVSASWGFDHGSNLRYSVQDQSSAAVLECRWDLFTGGARQARVRVAQCDVLETGAILKRFRLAVESQVQRAIIDLNDTQRQIRLRRESLDTSFENRRIIQARYLAGKETLTRLNESQRDYIAADADLALARIRLRLAWSDLHAAAATYRETIGKTNGTSSETSVDDSDNSG